MKPIHLYLEKTESQPGISFKEGEGSIIGDSYPEDAIQFYKPVIAWMEQYLFSGYAKNKNNATEMICDVGYFNTGSRPFFLTIFNQLNELKHSGHQVNVTWFYDDEDEIRENDDVNFKALIDDFVVQIEYKQRPPKKQKDYI